MTGKDGYKGGDSFSKVADVLNSDVIDEGSVFCNISLEIVPLLFVCFYIMFITKLGGGRGGGGQGGY